MMSAERKLSVIKGCGKGFKLQQDFYVVKLDGYVEHVGQLSNSINVGKLCGLEVNSKSGAERIILCRRCVMTQGLRW